MSTLTNFEFVEDLIKNNGHFEDDPPVLRITEYTSAWGDKCWGIDYTPTTAYYETYYVREPKVIWERKGN